jgi:hypothetical protein
MSDAGSEHFESKDDEFRRVVKEYVSLHDEITDIRSVMNLKTKRKKGLTEFIIAYMKDQEKDICNLGSSGVLQMKKHKTSLSLKKDYVQELLARILNDDAKAKESAEYIFENKPSKETYKLHRGTTT